MRKRFSKIRNAKLLTTEGLLGKVTDLLIEDIAWSVRYLAVNLDTTLSPMANRHVLIAPAAITAFDAETNTISTILTSQRVIESLPLNWEKPISRQYEQSLVDYYGWPIYWFGRAVQMKPQMLSQPATNENVDSLANANSSNLRSVAEICGYRIQSHNGPAGVMSDLLINLDAWTIDHATAEPGSWLLRESSIFPTERISHVDRQSRHVIVDLSQTALNLTKTSNVKTQPQAS